MDPRRKGARERRRKASELPLGAGPAAARRRGGRPYCAGITDRPLDRAGHTGHSWGAPTLSPQPLDSTVNLGAPDDPVEGLVRA